jgi:hypothetical protein
MTACSLDLLDPDRKRRVRNGATRAYAGAQRIGGSAPKAAIQWSAPPARDFELLNQNRFQIGDPQPTPRAQGRGS